MSARASEYEILRGLLVDEANAFEYGSSGPVASSCGDGYTLTLRSEDPEAEYALYLQTSSGVLVWKVDCSNLPAALGYELWQAAVTRPLGWASRVE